MSLIELLSKYMSSASVRAAYERDPYKVFGKYGVKGELLKTLQKEGLLEAVASELEEARGRARGRIHPLGWGIAAMKVTDFSPDSVFAGDEFELTIEGEEFTKDTLAALVPPGRRNMRELITASKTVVVSSTELVGTFKVMRPGRYEVGAYRPANDESLPTGSWLVGDKLTVKQKRGRPKTSKKRTAKTGKARKR